MRILGIESSCDETALALLSDDTGALVVEKSIVLSQIATHEKYGGVVPEVAAREHLQAIFPMLKKEIPHDGAGIDVIAVTSGPGLVAALRVGVETAKTLAWAWKKPLVAVNHMEGHVYAAFVGAEPRFPTLCLLVSGGHTELIVMRGHGQFERIGETLDDAAGEAFDKVANMLGLGYPGGPKLSKLAEQGHPTAFAFPRALLDRDDYNFSFAGLKTAVLYTLRKNPEANLANIAASFQEAVVDVLVQKTMRAAASVRPASIILAGGVSANVVLRERLKQAGEAAGIPVFVPAFAYSMDNAAMIASAGYFRAQDPANFVDPLTLAADPNLELGGRM